MPGYPYNNKNKDNITVKDEPIIEGKKTENNIILKSIEINTESISNKIKENNKQLNINTRNI